MSEKMNLKERMEMLRIIQIFLEHSADESDYDYLCNFLPEAASNDELEYVAASEDIYNTICDIFEEHIQRGGWRTL